MGKLKWGECKRERNEIKKMKYDGMWKRENGKKSNMVACNEKKRKINTGE